MKDSRAMRRDIIGVKKVNYGAFHPDEDAANATQSLLILQDRDFEIGRRVLIVGGG